MQQIELSADEARRASLRAQGLLGTKRRPETPAGVLQLTGAIQLDTISVLARSHELVCYSRHGSTDRKHVENALWGLDDGGVPHAFEYWAHAACVIPIQMWPLFAFRRRANRRRHHWGMSAPESLLGEVRRRLRSEGPLTATELGGAKGGGPWWDWSPVKEAVELLLYWGEVVCVERRGWRRVYSLTEETIPAELLDQGEPDDEACISALAVIAARRLGVATASDLARYFTLPVASVRKLAGTTSLLPVVVAGWNEPAWADPAAIEDIGARGRHRTTLLSPFDSLIWNRDRTERVFGMQYRLEAYTPREKRVHGYFSMPVLAGGRLVGRVDPGRTKSTLVAKQVTVLSPAWTAATAAALREAASWVGCDEAVVCRVDPPGLLPVLQGLLS